MHPRINRMYFNNQIMQAGMQKPGGLMPRNSYSLLILQIWEVFSDYLLVFSDKSLVFSNYSLMNGFYFPFSSTKSNLKIYLNK